MAELFDIDSLDLEARGVARRHGKVVFVEGALPGERVLARVTRRKSSFEVAQVEQVVRASSQRTQPLCPNFGVCGGCAIQHLDVAAQVATKQRALEDSLWHIGKVRPEQILPALHGPAWGYRQRARFSVRLVPGKGGVLVGFREKRSNYVVDMTECLVLPPPISALLQPLRALIGTFSAPATIPQVEVAAGDSAVVLLLRHLAPLADEDLRQLELFANRHHVSWWLQPGGVDSAHPIHPEDEDALAYTLPEFGLRIPFRPTDFTQVNNAVNRVLVGKAVQLLELHETNRVADMFCGLGNFSLPLASRARAVVGIDASDALIGRAQATAAACGLARSAAFTARNLFEVDTAWLRGLGTFDRMLFDPPREGAQALAVAVSGLTPSERPRRLVYVSCNPATLARDAGILARDGGYRLLSAGVVNMFPHTAHVESIAVFALEPR
ncbi:MAG: 23S rRNA (uracil(1939)-C(5))-methyltransferase RlmD [Candidimonas sp.]|nr:MAG: 23S rRNA (uracil(1939)-C(5))-methyltransferase RlmD [Candidimonas sp.]